MSAIVYRFIGNWAPSFTPDIDLGPDPLAFDGSSFTSSTPRALARFHCLTKAIEGTIAATVTFDGSFPNGGPGPDFTLTEADVTLSSSIAISRSGFADMAELMDALEDGNDGFMVATHTETVVVPGSHKFVTDPDDTRVATDYTFSIQVAMGPSASFPSGIVSCGQGRDNVALPIVCSIIFTYSLGGTGTRCDFFPEAPDEDFENVGSVSLVNAVPPNTFSFGGNLFRGAPPAYDSIKIHDVTVEMNVTELLDVPTEM